MKPFSKRFRRPYINPVDYPDDIQRIILIANLNGYDIDIDTATWAWEQYSENYAAGWLCMDGYTNDDIFRILKMYLIVEPAE